MPPITSCTPCAATPVVSNVPGPTGASAVTTTAASFVIPAVGATVTTAVTDTSWMELNGNLFIGGANFQLTGINSSTSITIKTLGVSGDTAVGATVASGSIVLPGGGNVVFPVSIANGGTGQTTAALAFAALYAGSTLPIANGGTGQATRLAAITALINSASISGVSNFTDNTTGAAGDTMAAGVGVITIPFYVNLADLAAADLITTFTLGYKFKILAVNFVVEKAATTISKAVTLTPKISGVAVTGGVLALTSANCTPQGAVVNGTAVTAANTGSSAATISITGSAVTAFVEGGGWVVFRIQNMDTADAFASLSSKVNSILNALKT